jgi:hypothetical protein
MQAARAAGRRSRPSEEQQQDDYRVPSLLPSGQPKHQGIKSRSLLGTESQPLAFVNGTIGSPRLRRVVLCDEAGL